MTACTPTAAAAGMSGSIPLSRGNGWETLGPAPKGWSWALLPAQPLPQSRPEKGGGTGTVHITGSEVKQFVIAPAVN